MNTRPTEEELRNMRNKGMTLYQISRKCNTTILDIFQLEKEYGMISLNTSIKRYYTINKQDLASMYIGEHMSQLQIAKELGCTQGAVSRQLAHHHIPPKGRGNYTDQERAMKYDGTFRLRDDEHPTLGEIGKKCEYNQRDVLKLLQEREVRGA